MDEDIKALVSDLREAYGLVAKWPEKSPDGLMKLLALRNMVPYTADALERLAQENEALKAAIKLQAGAASTLRHHTLAEVQRLIDKDRSEYNATKTLDSEREANAILTEQLQAAEARVAELEAGQAAHVQAPVMRSSTDATHSPHAPAGRVSAEGMDSRASP